MAFEGKKIILSFMKCTKFFFLLMIAGLFFFSCKKDSFINSADARLSFSADTLKFDTVFVTAGSVSRVVKIINNNNQKLRISSIKLSGGAASPFRINVNGTASPEVNNVELAANDSMYVFVTVFINPGLNPLPFIISDSISVSYNGNTRFIQLQAYGQNAVFLNNKTISTNTTWNNSLPYVILGGIKIASGATLTIEAGTKIYAHANAAFIVDGTMLANGTFSNKITFKSDRLDEPYKFFPAGWPGIFFRDSSKNNIITYAEILNAFQAIVVLNPSQNSNPKLILKQTLIDNAFNAGIICSNTKLVAENCLISNCSSNIVLQLGGDYNFIHCTSAVYSTRFISHSFPALSVSDYALVNGNVQTASLVAVFRNSIFWGDNGNVDNEVQVTKEGNTVSITFDHCLYKAAGIIPFSTFIAPIKNQDPLFDSIDYSNNIYDFRISKNPSSPAVNKGINTTLLKDLDNNNRNVGLPDLGCYEKQ